MSNFATVKSGQHPTKHRNNQLFAILGVVKTKCQRKMNITYEVDNFNDQTWNYVFYDRIGSGLICLG